MTVFIGGNRDARLHKARKPKEGHSCVVGGGPLPVYLSFCFDGQAAGKGDEVATPS